MCAQRKLKATRVLAPAEIGPRRAGRPSRVDRQAIADAVLEIGLQNSSMKAVAAYLGISVPGLYHHVKNKRDLLLLAAERSMTRMRLPEYRGQHWSEWLREWARYTRSAFISEPQVFAQFMSGAIKWSQMVDVIESVQVILSSQGFSPVDAIAAWSAVTQCALGSVVAAIRDQVGDEPWHEPLAELARVLGEHPADELTSLRAVVEAARASSADDFFEDQLTTVLVGIAARRGEDWRFIVEKPRFDDQIGT